MRTFLRGKALLFLTLGLLLAVPAIALADNFQNTLAATETGTRTITTDGTTAGSTTVGYRVIGNSAAGDTQSGCNVTDGSALSVSFSVANVTANPNSLSFTQCGNTGQQNVTFSSTTPGTYIIDPALSDSGTGTYQDQSPFTLHVQGTGTSVTEVSGSGTEGLSDGSLSAKLVWNNNNVGGKTISFAIDKEKNGTFTNVGSATTDNTTGVATLSDVSLAGLAPGTYDLKATFAADNNYAGDDTTGTLTVNSANTAPELTLPANITEEATGPNGAPVNFAVSANDAEDDPDPTPSCTRGTPPATVNSGATFALGTTTVNCSVTDSGGLEDSGSFTVTVVDTRGPVLDLPANITGVEATGPGGAPVNFTASANDVVDGSRSVTCTRGTPPATVNSGATFALGTTTVNCSASDTRGNESTGSFTVTVVDTRGPVLDLPANITTTAPSNSAATVNFTATANDVVDGSRPVTCNPASGTSFSAGTTTVNCSSSDSRGNTSNGSFTVTVNYNWSDFFQPIDRNPDQSGDPAMATVYNSAKAGQAIPIKFSLSGNQGMSIFATKNDAGQATSYPRTVKVQCPGADDTVDAIETYSSSNAGLQYDPIAGQYIYTWKTATSLAGTCQMLDLKLADGKHHYAFFKLTR